MYQINGFIKFAELDNYEQGCDPDSTVMQEVSMTFTGKTIQAVIDQALSFLGMEADAMEVNACDEDGRIDFQGMECEDGTAPSKAELARWKRGEIKLWAVTYTAHVEEVKPVRI